MKKIPLTQGKFAIVDDADFEKVAGVKWYALKVGRRFYAVRNSPTVSGKKTSILMHRVITDCPPDLEVNHKNGDGLDNRRQTNLQVCTHQQNVFAFRRKKKGASSKYCGVSWHRQNKCWRAQIKQNGNGINIGCFNNEDAAARAYDAKARELFGEYASPNFPLTVTTT